MVGTIAKQGTTMATEDSPEQPEYLSPKDMRSWLGREIKDATKALELRLRDATDLVTAYTQGELTPAEADERHSRYYHRWGESLPGATASDTVTDADILAAIDKGAESTWGVYRTPQEIHRKYVERFGGSAKRPPESSR
jgi:hypothetical protein